MNSLKLKHIALVAIATLAWTAPSVAQTTASEVRYAHGQLFYRVSFEMPELFVEWNWLARGGTHWSTWSWKEYVVFTDKARSRSPIPLRPGQVPQKDGTYLTLRGVDFYQIRSDGTWSATAPEPETPTTLIPETYRKLLGRGRRLACSRWSNLRTEFGWAKLCKP